MSVVGCRWASSNPCHAACGLEDIRPDWCSFDSKACGWCGHFNDHPSECEAKMLTHPGKLEPPNGMTVVRKCQFRGGQCIASP
eukprot:5590292-Prymnesium_polylepis.1